MTAGPVRYFGFPETRNYLVYYTNSAWLADGQTFLFMADQGREFGLFACHAPSGRIEPVYRLADWASLPAALREEEILNLVLLPRRRQLLLPRGAELRSLDLGTGRLRTLHTFPAGKIVRGPLAVDAGERYLCGGLYPEPATGGVPLSPSVTPAFIYDLAENRIVATHEFPLHANHFQFFPDGERLLYAHEGRTETIPDRLNEWHWPSGRTRGLYQQQRNAAGELIEYVGHEMVAGHQVAAVRYPVSRTEAFGLLWVDPATGQGELLDADDYWHCASDRNGERLVMDTMWWGRSGRRTEHHVDILLFERRTRRKTLLAHGITDNRTQSAHPHPRFSPAGDLVCFATKRDPASPELLIGAVALGN